MRVSRRIKKILSWSFVSLYIAGAGYWLSRLFLKQKGLFGEEPHITEKILGPTHLALAFFFIFVLGLVWEKHIRVALKVKKNRLSGWLFISFILFLAISGIAVVYGGEDLMKLAEKIHPWFGAGLLPILGYHVWTRIESGAQKSR